LYFGYGNPRRTGIQNPRVSHRWNLGYILEDAQKLWRLSEFWLNKRANIFEDIRTELGLYLPLYSSNRELLASSRRGTAKIPEIFGVLYSYRMLNRVG